MAVSTLSIGQISSFLFQDTANTNGAIAVKASSASVSYIECDNTANGSATYTKLYSLAAASVVVGTTVPDTVIYVPASTLLKFPLPTAWVYGTALSVPSVTAGGTAGVTAPATPITVRIAYT